MEKQKEVIKVAYAAPMSIAAVNGGIRAQAVNTIHAIKKFNVEPVFVSPWTDISELKPDLVHIFGALPENGGIMASLHKREFPVVLSTVFYSNRHYRLIKSSIHLEKWTSVFGSGIRSDFSIKAEICRMADLLLPNTKEEAALVEKGFSILKDKIEVIHNGVETRFADANPALFTQKYGLKDFVLFAGQAGAPRKNAIRLLKAATALPAPVVIIGNLPDTEYGLKCRELAANSDNVTLIDTLAHDDELLASAYAACKVFVLPSQYETPGIAALEAGLAGANIAITAKGGTKEVFRNYAEYINPNSEISLIQAVQRSLKKPKNEDLKLHILQHFTWDKTAEKTALAYRKLLS